MDKFSNIQIDPETNPGPYMSRGKHVLDSVVNILADCVDEDSAQELAAHLNVKHGHTTAQAETERRLAQAN